ncbi:hypothetical protein AC482_02745 [miscellaneous Crenarchaeota group-15 archaeon DG-45]|uniref:EamA domain-containing protein n=1 Tax=miscellaneous Crenarchaeota group-15 archaeon DG-45 TaxID=1685127 RepID=A0A0M0BQL5_9ARCH|nr:MAG: hypothetical protein AC482_02745 [miscellaneous Crenarchaeota group-15 archaeon DG-45]
MWLTYSLITLFIWGFWSILIKMALDHLSWQQLTLISTLAGLPAYVILFLYYRPSMSLSSPGFYPALLIGLVSPIALITNYLALSLGKISVVVPLIALYPVVTVALSIFLLGEKITIAQGAGVVFAALAIVLFSFS